MTRKTLLLSVVLAILTVVALSALAFPAAPEAPGEGEIELTVQPADPETGPPAPGEQRTYEVVVEDPDNGILSYTDIVVDIADSSVGAITAFDETTESGLSNSEIRDDGATLSLEATTLDDFSDPASEYVIAEFQIEADDDAPGEQSQIAFDTGAEPAVTDFDDDPYDIVGQHDTSFAVDDPLTDIDLSITETDLVFGETETTDFEVTAINESGASADVTEEATVTVEDTAVVSLANGDLEAAGVGTTTVTATYDGEEDTETVGVSDQLAAIDLSITETDLVFGETETTDFEVTAINESGATATVTEEAGVTVDDTAVVSVTNGELSAEGAGATTVTATYDGEEDTESVSVTDPLADLELTIIETDLVFGETETTGFEVTATNESGTSEDVTDEATVTVEDTSIVTLENGALQAAGEGSTTVTATFDSLEDSETVTVDDPLVGIDLVLSETDIVEGEQVPYTVEAEFGSGGTDDVTAAEGLSVSAADSTIVLVDEGESVVEGIDSGTTQVTATYESFTDSATVSVDDHVVDVDLTIAEPELVFGATERTDIDVVATFESGETQDVVDDAAISIDDTGVLTQENGELVAEDVGTTTVTAAYEGEEDTETVSVTDQLATIDLSITETDLVFGETETTDFEVTATNESGTTEDVTDEAVVTVEDTAVVSLTNGELEATGHGTTTVTATYDGEEETETVSVSDPLATIELDITETDLVFGETETTDFEVTATNESGTTAEVTDESTVTVEDTSVITLANGELEASGEGSTAVTATFETLEDSETVTVADPLVDIDLSLTDTNLSVGETTAYSVAAEFASGGTEEITDDEMLSVAAADQTVATVDSENATIDAIEAGTTDVTATFEDRTDSAPLTVEQADAPATFQVTALEPAETTIPTGASLTVAGTVQNVGDLQGTQTIELAVGSISETRNLTLSGGEMDTVVFENVDTTALEPGSYNYTLTTANDSLAGDLTVSEPRFVAAYDLDRTELRVDQTLTVNATVKNIAAENGTLTVPLVVGNETVDSATIDVAGESNKTVSFTWDPTYGEASVTVADLEPTAVSVLGPDVTGNGDPATDTTGDTLLEDVTGDGTFGIHDVQTLFDFLEADSLQNHAHLFDFHGATPERVTIFDVQAQFNMLATADGY